MTSSCTPADVIARAMALGVDLAAEPYLLPIVRLAVQTPLPPQWSEVETTAGPGVARDRKTTTTYRNQVTLESQHAHPADAYFLGQLHELRDRMGDRNQCGSCDGNGDAEADCGAGWMEFEEIRGDGGGRHKYYYNFITQARQDTAPRNWPRHGDALDSALSITDATQEFAQAESLHKATASTKNLESLEILCFTSWWTESALHGSAKRALQVYFSIPTRHLQVVLADSAHVFTISHTIGANARVVSAWDLHVGARLLLLGRWTTLMQPSLLTRQWLALHEKRFRALQLEVDSELRKYELKKPGRMTPVVVSTPVQCAEPHKSVAGTSLRGLLTAIHESKSRLAKYRPDVARRFVLPLDHDL